MNLDAYTITIRYRHLLLPPRKMYRRARDSPTEYLTHVVQVSQLPEHPPSRTNGRGSPLVEFAHDVSNRSVPTHLRPGISPLVSRN